MKRTATWAAVTAAAALLAGSAAVPASARTMPGDYSGRGFISVVERHEVGDRDGQCSLRRIGSQLVRCDNLTGTGAAAPASVPVF